MHTLGTRTGEVCCATDGEGGKIDIDFPVTWLMDAYGLYGLWLKIRAVEVKDVFETGQQWQYDKSFSFSIFIWNRLLHKPKRTLAVPTTVHPELRTTLWWVLRFEWCVPVGRSTRALYAGTGYEEYTLPSAIYREGVLNFFSHVVTADPKRTGTGGCGIRRKSEL